MADNISITQGTGTTVATDDCGAAGHTQIVKLAISTDGSATPIPADGTAGLKVNLGADNDITGTVTANLSATDNAVLDAIVVDTGALKKSINGPSAPTIDSYGSVAINLAAGANQVLVSSAANKQIWVYGYHIMVNVAGTVSFQDEDDTALSGIMPFAANGGATVHPSGNFSMPIWKLGTDKDLEIDLVTAECDGWICYGIISI